MRVIVRQLDTPKQGHDLEVIAEAHYHDFHDRGADKREFSRDGVLLYTKQYGPQRERKVLNCWLAYDLDNGEQVVGYLLAKTAQPYGSPRLYAYLEMMYVLPQYRNIMTLAALLHEFDEWARECNCERQHLTVEYDDDDEQAKRMVRMYELLGYKLRGYITAKYVDYSRQPQAQGPEQ